MGDVAELLKKQEVDLVDSTNKAHYLVEEKDFKGIAIPIRRLEAIDTAIREAAALTIDPDFAKSGDGFALVLDMATAHGDRDLATRTALVQKQEDIKAAYTEFLNEERVKLAASIAAGETAFRNKKATLDLMPKLEDRKNAIQTAIDSSASDFPENTADHYSYLLQTERQRLDSLIVIRDAAKAKFDSNHFEAKPDGISRLNAIKTAITNVPGLGLNPDVAAMYTQLLTDAQAIAEIEALKLREEQEKLAAEEKARREKVAEDARREVESKRKAAADADARTKAALARLNM